MKKPKVSVIVPVYNTEQYLEQCLSSIVNQRLKEIEIICIDDGSTDKSIEILNEFSKHDSRFMIYQSEKGNQGPGAIRNMALKKATGEYISFVDSDDFIHKNMLKSLYSSAINEKPDIVMCSTQEFITKPGDTLLYCDYDHFLPTNLDRTTFTWLEIKDILFKLRFACWNKLYRKSFLVENDIEFSEGIFYEDLFFTYKALLCAASLKFVRKVFYFNRIHRPGSTTSIQSSRSYDGLKAIGIFERYLRERKENDLLKDSFMEFKLRKYLLYLPKNDADHIEQFYNELKKFVSSPALDENIILSDKQKIYVEKIRKNDLLQFLTEECYELTTSYKAQKMLSKNSTIGSRMKRLGRRIIKQVKGRMRIA